MSDLTDTALDELEWKAKAATETTDKYPKALMRIRLNAAVTPEIILALIAEVRRHRGQSMDTAPRDGTPMSELEDEESRGTFACPICGLDTPHYHSEEQVAAYREDTIRHDDWVSAAHRNPKESGWYLCLGVEVDPSQYGEPKSFMGNERWSQLSWLLWVRFGGNNGSRPEEIPEVLWYGLRDGRWRLRNLLGNAVRSGAESRFAVRACPKYWRALPACPVGLPKEPTDV